LYIFHEAFFKQCPFSWKKNSHGAKIMVQVTFLRKIKKRRLLALPLKTTFLRLLEWEIRCDVFRRKLCGISSH